MSTYLDTMESDDCENGVCTSKQKSETDIKFWSDNPNVLLQREYIFEFFPTETMTYEQKLNAISRIVIVLTLLGFAYSRSVRLIIISAITLASIYMLYHYKSNEDAKMDMHKRDLEKNGAEGFEGPALDLLKQNNVPISDDMFMEPSPENPFSNVMLNDYDYNPNKKPAPAATKASVNAQIFKEAKQLVSNLNPDQPDIANKLFKDLGEQYVFEQSLRPFYSTASTTIPNDQTGFADFCYGSMISCKEGNQFACARNLSRHINM